LTVAVFVVGFTASIDAAVLVYYDGRAYDTGSTSDVYFDATTAFRDSPSRLTGANVHGGNYSSNDWGAEDTSVPHVEPENVEGRGSAGEMVMTLNGLTPNQEYSLSVVGLTHTSASENWGLVVGTSPATYIDTLDRTNFDVNISGVLGTESNGGAAVPRVQWDLGFTSTADASGDLALYFNRNSGVRSFFDGVIAGPVRGELGTPQFKIDIDSTYGGAPLSTADGWTSLDGTGGDGSTVTVDGTTFTVFSADGSRNRITSGLPNPTALTSDFVFDDGGGVAVGLVIDDLPAGTWEAKVWAWDQAAPLDDLIVGWIEGSGPENIVTTSAIPDPVHSIVTFRFTSDGNSLYRIFTRENNGQNRARFNALQLTRIPEPSTFILSALGLVGLAFVGRKRRKKRTG